jgi:hypothetical protein
MSQDRFDSEEFYELMQRYRTTPGWADVSVLTAFEAVKKFARATPKHGEAAGWQDIETAPKDQEILLCDAEGVRVVGRWGKHNHVPLYGWIRQVELYGEEVDGFDAVLWAPLLAAPKEPKP